MDLLGACSGRLDPAEFPAGLDEPGLLGQEQGLLRRAAGCGYRSQFSVDDSAHHRRRSRDFGIVLFGDGNRSDWPPWRRQAI